MIKQEVMVSCAGPLEQMGRVVEAEEVAPCFAACPLAKNPPLYGVVLPKESAARKIIEQSRAFVVNDASQGSKELVPATKVLDTRRLKGAEGWLECEAVEFKDVGENCLIIGRIVYDDNAYELLRGH